MVRRSARNAPVVSLNLDVFDDIATGEPVAMDVDPSTEPTPVRATVGKRSRSKKEVSATVTKKPKNNQKIIHGNGDGDAGPLELASPMFPDRTTLPITRGGSAAMPAPMEDAELEEDIATKKKRINKAGNEPQRRSLPERQSRPKALGFDVPTTVRRSSDEVAAATEEAKAAAERRQEVLRRHEEELAELELREEDEDSMHVNDRIASVDKHMSDEESDLETVKKPIKNRKISVQEVRQAVEKKKKELRVGRGKHIDEEVNSTSSTRKGGRTQDKSPDPLDHGGLGDEQAQAVKPKTPKAKGRPTTTVSIETLVSPSIAATPTPKHAKGSRKPITTPAQKPNVNKQASTESIDESQLPAFAISLWKAKFLPSLYACFYASDNPFNGWAKDLDLVAVLQTVLDDVYDGNTYKVQLNDRICNMAYSRICEKRSQFGRRALHVVKNSVFKDTVDATIAEPKLAAFCKYALQANGPALWKVPGPPSSIRKVDASLIASDPSGLFESDTFVNVFSFVVGDSLNVSAAHYGDPIGALVLSAAAIERAFTLCSYGRVPTAKETTNFSTTDPVLDEAVEQYMETAKKLSPRRWRRLLVEVFQCVDEADPETRTTKSTPSDDLEDPDALKYSRAALYVPSSPICSDED